MVLVAGAVILGIRDWALGIGSTLVVLVSLKSSVSAEKEIRNWKLVIRRLRHSIFRVRHSIFNYPLAQKSEKSRATRPSMLIAHNSKPCYLRSTASPPQPQPYYIIGERMPFTTSNERYGSTAAVAARTANPEARTKSRISNIFTTKKTYHA